MRFFGSKTSTFNPEMPFQKKIAKYSFAHQIAYNFLTISLLSIKSEVKIVENSLSIVYTFLANVRIYR
jgi:hypothetical protein